MTLTLSTKNTKENNMLKSIIALIETAAESDKAGILAVVIGVSVATGASVVAGGVALYNLKQARNMEPVAVPEVTDE